MKNRFFILLFVVALSQSLLAVPARPGWKVYTTDEGSSVTLRMVGDEFGHWLEDGQGVAYVLQDDGTVTLSSQTAEQLSTRRKSSPRFQASRPNRAIGKINLAPRGIVILVNYTDVKIKSENTQAAFNEMMNASSYTYRNTHNSVREYFRAQSRGKYVPDFDVYGPVKINNTCSHYGTNDSNGDDMYPGDVIVEAVKAVDAQYDVDFTLYNNDGDDEIDFVYVIYAGKGEADGGAAYTIWPHNWDLSSAYSNGNCTYAKSQRMVDGLYVDNYAMSGELDGYTGYRASIGTISHEFGHVLGLPDFYDTSSGTNSTSKLTPGYYDIMDSGSYSGKDSDGNNYCGTCPPNYSPWERIYFGWDTPTNFGTRAVNMMLYPSEHKNYKCYQINSAGAYQSCTTSGINYYIENRQQTGWDTYLPGHGMLVWIVNYNSSYWTQNRPNYSNYGNPHYTLVSAYGTAITSNANTYPGTYGVTSWTSLSSRPVTKIAEYNGIVTAAYMGGASNMCGDNLFWSLSSDNKVLTISGYGDMWDFTYKTNASTMSDFLMPWVSAYETIEQVVLPDGITSIGDYAFFNHRQITDINLPSSLTRIGSYSLARISCTDITIPEAVTEIGDYAFAAAVNLTSITIPKNVANMGMDVFYNCSALTTVNYNAANCLISDDYDTENPFASVRSQITSFNIGDDVQVLPAGLCYQMTGLTSVAIPAQIASVSANVFKSCSSLATVRFYHLTPPAFSATSFSSIASDAVGEVICGTVPAYAATTLPFTSYTTFGDFIYTVTLTVENPLTGSVDWTTPIDCSTNMGVITATPAEHYHFARWTDDAAIGTAAGAERSVYVTEDVTYTAVFEEDTKYTVTVGSTGHGTAITDKSSCYSGETAVLAAVASEGYTFWQWSDGDISNPREVVVTKDTALNAMFTQNITGLNSNFSKHAFTVGDNDKRIVFSQANLQYQASTQTFRFAYNQYDFIGAYNARIADDYAGWIDLFGWGTGAQPTQNSCTDCGTFFPYDGDLEDPDDTFDAPARRNTPQDDDTYSTFVDWGTNSIINGGNTANEWRTMTAGEWNYLFHSREDASYKFGFATVNSIRGLVILPDDWELPAECTFVAGTQAGLEAIDSHFINSSENNFSHNTYTSEQWIKMEAAGAVFLPAAGNRAGKTYEGANTEGYYWSSTGNEESTAFTVFFDNEAFYPNAIRHRAQGYSVRLVKEMEHVHDWGEVVYDWNDDYTLCTATRVCNNDASHIETETVSSVVESVNATCTEEGTITYTATFDNEAFAEQVHTETVAALGHDWGEVVYDWNDDYSQCTATRVCNNDASHIETETVSSVAETTPATGTENGYITYTATFTNEAFETQVYVKTLEALPSDIVLQENESDEYYTWFTENYNGVKVTTATLNRQFKQNVWSTLCLPFNLSRGQMTALGLNGRVFEFQYTEKLDDASLQIYFAVAKSIQAGMGYIVSANAKLNQKTSFIFSTVTVNTDADVQSGYDIMALPGYNSSGSISLVGTLRTGNVFNTPGGTTFYGLSNNQLKKVKDGTNFPAYRGFFRSDEPMSVQRVRIVAEGEPVAEMDVVNDELEEATNAVKYIENGVLYIRCNGKVYNALGTEIQ